MHNSSSFFHSSLFSLPFNETKIYFESINNALLEGFKSIKPENCVTNQITRNSDTLFIQKIPISLTDRNIYIIGGGKATYNVVSALIPIIKDKFVSGIINIPKNAPVENNSLPNTTIIKAGHPIPDQETFRGSQMQLDLLVSLSENDIVFIIVSGGASALIEIPTSEISEEDLINTYKLLLVSGLPIQHINAIRKHLSAIKGGKLAIRTKAQIIGLLMSDVPGDDLATIGSGPTVEDETTFQECLSYLHQSNLSTLVPQSVITLLNDGLSNTVPETIKHFPANLRIHNFLLCSNMDILQGLANQLSKVLQTKICTNSFSGEATDIGRFLFNYINYIYVSIPICLVFGGESVVTINKNQIQPNTQGGRNQELLLSFIIAYLEANCTREVILLSLGTDGIDGQSTHAGAIFCNELLQKYQLNKEQLQKSLTKHDSANGLPMEFYIKTGPTGTNVGDIIILIMY